MRKTEQLLPLSHKTNVFTAMKKTIITILATAVAATAQAGIVCYEGSITTADGLVSTLPSTVNEGNLWFNEDNARLSSWALEFTISGTTFTGWSQNVFSTTNRSDDGWRPLGMMLWQGVSAGMTIQKSHYSNGVTNLDTGVAQGSINGYGAEDFPLTMRLAYDAEASKFYLLDVTNSVAIVTGDLSSQNNMQTDLVSGVAGTKSTSLASMFFSTGKFGISDIKVWDLTSVAGTDAFVAYVPEPATATLSLLALVGLASRRRRH